MINIIFKCERWKYNSDYQVYVSSEGRLKDKNKKEILPKISHNYLFYTTSINHISKRIPVHRLVMITFKPVENYKELTVDHLNHNTRDNRLQNLEWVEEEENHRRAQRDLDIEVERDYNLGKDIGIPISKTSKELFLLNGIVFDKDSIIQIILSCPNLKNQEENVRRKLNKIFNSEQKLAQRAFGFLIEPYEEELNPNLKIKINGFIFTFQDAVNFIFNINQTTCSKEKIRKNLFNFIRFSPKVSTNMYNLNITKI